MIFAPLQLNRARVIARARCGIMGMEAQMGIDWITPNEAAELSGYHPEHLRELIREKKISAIKKGYAWWVDQKSLGAYLKAAKKSRDGRRGPKST